MHTFFTPEHLRGLYQVIEEAPLPSDDYKNHQHFKPMRLNNSPRSADQFEVLVTQFVSATARNQGGKHLAALRQHWQWMLLNLSSVLFQRQWLVVSLTKNDYSRDAWLKQYEFKYSPVKAIVEFLDAEGLVERKQGKKYANDPARTRLFPTDALASQLWQFFLDAEQPIEPPYVTINDPQDQWGETVLSLEDDHPEMAEMMSINEYLQGHHWACKAPVRLTYKHSPFQGGRLITPFQNLPMRHMRLRINTLIDGEPICEVDFSANHLRLNLAHQGGIDAGPRPYEDIGEAAGLHDRDQVKRFVTVALGAINETKARAACSLYGINNDQFDRLRNAALRVFPKLSLFSGWGTYAQGFEGQILKHVMLSGIADDVVVLPIHDAVAVKLDDAGWGTAAMNDAWARVMGHDGLSIAYTEIP